MLIEQLGPAACRSYLIGCERASRALVVDPLADDVERVVERLGRRGLELDVVVDTHTHADHHSGGRAFARRASVPYAQHESSECTGVDEKLADGHCIEVGDVRVEVLHTPGHTPDSITLCAGPNLFTGDFLFLAQDGAGRLDLPGSDPAAHWDSLKRLAAVGDEHRVWPGHDYQGLTDSTLGTERTRNPRFQNVTREEYVTWQRAIAAPTPQWMLEVIASNLGTAPAHVAHHAPAVAEDDPAADDACASGSACAAGPLDLVPLLQPAEARRRTSEPEGEPPYFIDVREPWEYAGPAGRHAAGTRLIPLRELPGRLHELPGNREREVLVICKSGRRSAKAAAFLIANGWRRVFNVATGTDGWARAGLPTEN